MNDLSPYIENQHCLGVNKLPARSPLIPARKEGVYYRNKEQSDMLLDLNGDYAFRYSLRDDTPEFYRCDYDASDWDCIDVPSMWQFRGFGKPRYTNIPYPFPFDPPYIDGENPVGYYRRTFTVPKTTPVTILHFAGVENAFFVYMNGEFVGFSKGSRNAAEFDVSGLVTQGENILCVKVMTYSDASYLECQDMLWSNGIFRDVYLMQLDEVYVRDFRVTSDLRSFYIRSDLCFDGQPGYRLCVRVDDSTQVFDAAKSISAVFTPSERRLWTAETPELYSLTLTLLYNDEVVEVHSKKIGMLHSRIEGGEFLVNDSPVYIKGVNRHEYDCDNGRAISRENIEKELRMIKANHLNAVRTSHYPNDPVFYELCSEIGLYVLDEADIETHGCCECGNMSLLTEDPEWLDAYLDRTRRMLELDKNEPCVFIHSMGNEFGEGSNNYACQSLAMEFAPDILAIADHDAGWEFLVEQGPHEQREHFIRTGYLSEKQMDELDEKLPLFMQIEYGHGMGNGPGFLEGYQDYAYTHKTCFGGFVWEFKSHGFHVRNPDGTHDYLYGGDFGDRWVSNASNFCLDGYLMSDRTPKHTWRELGAVMAPAWISVKGEKCTIRNTFDFLSFVGAECLFELNEDGRTVDKLCVGMPGLLPHEEYTLPIPASNAEIKDGAAYFLNISVLQDGDILGRYQHEIGIIKPKKSHRIPSGELTVTQSSFDCVHIAGEAFGIELRNGLIARFEKDSETLIDSPLDFNFMRAPTDNDLIRSISNDLPGNLWENEYLHTMRFTLRGYEIAQTDHRVTVKAKGKIVPQTRCYGADAEIVYNIYPDGLISVHVSGNPYGSWCERDMPIPRIGMKVRLEQKDCVLDWLGRGPGENWPDCRRNSPVGLYSLPVSESYTVFDRPQETGNHGDTRFVSLRYVSGASLSVVCSRSPFSFTAHDFSFDTLRAALHRSDLKKDGYTYLYIDSEVRGLGSRSCGPDPEPAYELKIHPFDFGFVLVGNAKQKELLELTHTDIE